MNEIIINRILLFVLVICLINVVIFLFVPISSYTLSFPLSLEEPWRIFTFQFFHIDILHLLENVVGFIFVALIATELEISFKEFSFTYLLATFAVILPLMFFYPNATVAGNSTGIYGLLALCLIKSRKLVSIKITIPIIIALIFSLSILNFILCDMCFLYFFKGEFLHFSGFLVGITLSFMLKEKPKLFKV